MKTTNNTSSSLPTFGRTLALLMKSTVLLTRTTFEVISVGHESVVNNSKLANQIDTDSLKDIFQGRAESNEMSREYLRAGMDTITNIFSSDEEVKAKTKSAFDRAEAEVEAEATVSKPITEEVKPEVIVTELIIEEVKPQA